MKEVYHDEKVGNRYILSPQENKLRREFLRKVYLISIAQLFFTICGMIPVIFHSAARDYLNEKHLITIISVILMSICTMFLMFCSWLARLPLINYVVLVALTSFTAFWMTCLCVKYSHTQVGTAIIITIILAFSLGFFSMHTAHDFTLILGVLLVVSMIALILGLLYFRIASPRLKWAIMIGSFILTCVYFLSDVQMIITGDRTFFLDLESHVLGACILYIDLVYLFIYVLMIIGDFRGMKLT